MHQVIAATLFVVANWTFNPILWEADDAGLTVAARSSEFAVYQSESLYQRVIVASDVTVLEPLGESWKIAGVSVYQNHKNYWHFAMIASPGENPSRSFELAEMRDGVWLSQTNLKRTVDVSHGSWKPGETYRLMLALGKGWIEGRAIDAKGKELRRVRYEFTDVAVDRGKPALRSSGFKASFRKIETKMALPIAKVKPTYPPYQSKSFLSGINGKKTGFFHVEKHDGDMWTAIDPLGRGFLPLGVDHVTFRGHWCEALGYFPHRKKNEKKYPDPKVWEEETLGRLQKWGFNMIAAGGQPSLYRRGLTSAINLSVGERFARLGEEYDICEARGVPGSAFPNVFHPDFPTYCAYATRFCELNVDDPWLFGYFLDNELCWWGKPFDLDEGLFNACMAKEPTHSAKKALVAFVKDRYNGDLQKLNQAWQTDFKAFDDILARKELESKNDQVATDKAAFVEKIADTYFKVTSNAIRKHDPNHMILGCRFAGGFASDQVWKKAGEYCDVLAFNYYGNVNLEHGVAMNHDSPWTGETLREVFEGFYKVAQKPMIVTEWSFPALDAGLPSVHGAGQRFRTQAERAEATRIFGETMLRLPFMIGYDYFMWVDEPELGISEKFPEDSNYGLVNNDCEPYTLLTEMFTKLHQNASQLKREGFSKIGPPVKTPLKPKCVQGTLQPEPVQFKQEGDRYAVVAGKLKLEGKLGPGPFWSKVAFDDGKEISLGRFNGMVQHKTSSQHWDAVRRVIKVAPVGNPTAPTAIDFVGHCKCSDGLCEVAYRFTFFPKQDAFGVEMLWFKNQASHPLNVRGFYFRPRSDLGGDGKNDLPITEGGEGAPRLWGRPSGNAWLDAQLGYYWGVAGRPDTPTNFYFWLNGQGGQHPDARWETDLTIHPGETYRPTTPMKVLSIVGQGTQADWEKKAEAAVKQIAL